jgi:hypothetical protein
MVVLALLLLWGTSKGVGAAVRKVRSAGLNEQLEPARIPAWHPESLP